MTLMQNDPHRAGAGRRNASCEGRSDPNPQRNETVSIHYHIDTESQPGLHASTQVRQQPAGSPASVSVAVKHMQRLTGAPLSTARLLAELAGWALSQERAA